MDKKNKATEKKKSNFNVSKFNKLNEKKLKSVENITMIKK